MSIVCRPRPGRWRRASAFARPFTAVLVLVLFLSLLIAAVNAVEPLVLKVVFDELEGDREVRVLIQSLVLFIVLLAAREGISALSNWLTWRTRLELHHSVLSAAATRLHRLPISFHQEAGVGSTMTRLDRGIQGFLGAFNEVAFRTVPALVYLVISIVVMLHLDWRLALVVLAFSPVPPAIAALAAPTQVRRQRRLLDAWSRIYARFNEVLAGIVTVKSFVQEDAEKRRFLAAVADANDDVQRGVRFDSGVGALQNLVIAGARVTALGVGAALVIEGDVTLGTLIAFLGYVAGLFGPVQGLTGVYTTMRTASVALDTILEILDAPDQVADAPGARALGRVRGDVRYERVRFSYLSSGCILDSVDLHVAPGERIAIVGPSGAGKSTLMSLLQRFYDPSDGVVRVDGHDLRMIRQRSLRRHIGVVLQDALLFNDSAGANIAYGRPDAAEREIREAARRANADQFIRRLPEGYGTEVGERGARLSMGERQRIAIARAILKDPPILILDEATSALDAETEAQVQEALERLTRGRTTFIIAHRLSTVVDADRIVVLKDGRILEDGTHRELLRARGYYAGLVDRQVGRLLA